MRGGEARRGEERRRAERRGGDEEMRGGEARRTLGGGGDEKVGRLKRLVRVDGLAVLERHRLHDGCPRQ